MFRRVSDNVHYAVMFIKCGCAAQSTYPGIVVAFHETRLCQNNNNNNLFRFHVQVSYFVVRCHMEVTLLCYRCE